MIRCGDDGLTEAGLTEAAMAGEFEDPDQAADRLEAALERIARLAATPPPRPANVALHDNDLSISEITERLDALIKRLRAALDDAVKPD